MNKTGLGLALLSAVLFGVSTPFAKLLLGGMPAQMAAGLLYLGSGLGLAVVLGARAALRLPTHDEAPLARRDLPWLLGVIATGGVAGPLLLMLGLARTDAAGASLLLNVESIATLLIAWVVFRENVDRRLLLGAVCIVAGAVVLSWQGRATLSPGALYIVAACVCWGIDNNLSGRLSAVDPVRIAMLKGLVAGGVNMALALVFMHAGLPGPVLVAGAMAVGFAGYGISLVAFMLGLRHLGAARTGAYFALAPFVGAVVSLVVFGVHDAARLAVAGGLMGIGLWLHLSERHDHEHIHEEMAHTHRHVHDGHHQHTHTHDDPPGEPHTHYHVHTRLVHRHPHYPDLHHRHSHDGHDHGPDGHDHGGHDHGGHDHDGHDHTHAA
ncbi:DMT family transporter [Komagataeibacter rhaeticus]|uniref:DMT family transporter n=1 Tax=Komagataeibacter rhaeticus TaxID=215221 RepID=A0A181CAE6_9PROT|nr:DMT family transporter [Komagataeibacter rhaeticus]QIP35329.1 DMT family transporter [Komagataeibacter rhaeticus]QOC47894.1 DMT family transporter [Komagataeibacter rhaeticus]SAY48547.1 4-amino-4-deoxy-L-arabinose-phosphoundecaprenol flippase subunit ArnE [Komagataeibacter rhaeticus]